LAKAFISYKREVEPDEALAHRVSRSLQAIGHQVFIDQVIAPGTIWAKRIEDELAGSDWLVILLSEHSVQSEMVRAELETARRLAGAGGKPRILPIRVAFRGAFPYPLSAYLDGVQWAFWGGDGDNSALSDHIRRAIAGQDLPLPPAELLDAGPPSVHAAPMAAAQPVVMRGGPALKLERAEEPVHPESRFYVERGADADARDALAGDRAATITIQGPRQMGKTALLNRLSLAARSAGKRVVYLDFKLFDAAILHDRRALFEQFCAWFADELEVEAPLDGYWSKLPLPRACTKHVVEKLLRPLAAPVMLAADEVERLFDSPVRHDLFGMLRAWHDGRVQRPELARLDMVLVTSTDPDKFTRDDQAYGSPFNVGTVVRLADFSSAQIAELAERHRLALTADQRERLLLLFGGHPYLTRRALYLLATGQWSIGAEGVAEPLGPFGDHLRQYLLQLQPVPELGSELRRALRGDAIDGVSFDRLRGAGLLRGSQTRPEPRCELYAAFFGKHG
jgi:hypothetical protein